MTHPSLLRPKEPEYPLVPVGGRRSMDAFPVKYTHVLERNQKLSLCCRHVEENVTGQLYKTRPDLAAPDKLIMTCGGCDRNHHVLMVGEA